MGICCWLAIMGEWIMPIWAAAAAGGGGAPPGPMGDWIDDWLICAVAGMGEWMGAGDEGTERGGATDPGPPYR